MADSPLRFPYDCRMGIIGWIILGLLAGSIARAILPGHRGPGGCIGTTVVGVLGALLGGFIASALDIGQINDFFNLGTWLIAIGGSLLLLMLVGIVTRK